MRFVPDGPDIPADLLKAWLAGEVVFLAGAGISMPAPSRLPSFRDLALKTYERLHEPLAPVLRAAAKLKKPANQLKALMKSGLPADQVHEGQLFLSWQFDRLLSALEARLDHDATGKPFRRSVRNAVEDVLRTGGPHGRGHEDLVRLSTAFSDGQCRIVTTNFDRLLEAGWTAELGASPTSCDARVAARPGAYNFAGVIHLHGVLSATPSQPADFVLSSRDFARVYLRSGVVANYVYDLIRRYTVVLVGYSAEDPTMRYLMDAISEDAALFSDMKSPHAIAAYADGSPHGAELFEATWRAKGVQPIGYQPRSGKIPHGPLWESIAEWAEWAREGMDWVMAKLAVATALPPSPTRDFEFSLVQDLLAVLTPREQLAAVEHMLACGADFAWIEAIPGASDLVPVSAGDTDL